MPQCVDQFFSFVRLSTSLTFVRFKEEGLDEEPHGEGVVLRKRRFLMDLTGPPPPGTSVGTVTIKNPWDPSNSRNLNVLVRHDADLTAWPSVVTLGSTTGREAVILVWTKEATDKLDVVLEGRNNLSLSVDRKPVGESRRLHRVRLAIKRAMPPGRAGQAH